MIKIIYICLFMMLISCNSFSQSSPKTSLQNNNIQFSAAEEKRELLWKSFYQAQLKYFGEIKKIKLYAENHSQTEICFICERGLYIFHRGESEGNIEQVVHAKALLYENINRITYETNNDSGYFKLWSNQREELSVGAGK